MTGKIYGGQIAYLTLLDEASQKGEFEVKLPDVGNIPRRMLAGL